MKPPKPYDNRAESGWSFFDRNVGGFLILQGGMIFEAVVVDSTPDGKFVRLHRDSGLDLGWFDATDVNDMKIYP